MRTAMLPVILLHIFAYIVHCAGAPTSCSSSQLSHSPSPLPPPEYVRLRVWNKVNGPNVRAFDGYTELNFGQVVFNKTVNYGGFNTYLDPANTGMIRTPPSGFYGALIPTQTSGLYTFNFISRTMTPGVLVHGFTYKQLGCGMCIGKYLQYDTSSNDAFTDTTNSGFLIVPNPETGLQSWKLLWNNFTKNANIPADAQRIYLLKEPGV